MRAAIIDIIIVAFLLAAVPAFGQQQPDIQAQALSAQLLAQLQQIIQLREQIATDEATIAQLRAELQKQHGH